MQLQTGWLKEKRLSLSMTQSQAAEKSGISRAFYCEIEIGLKNPSVNTAKKIARALEFEWTVFFDQKCCVAQQEGA